MWTARVVLFFRCTFRRPGDDTRSPCTLALVNRLRPFTLQNARKSSANHLGWRVEPELCVAQRDLFREGTCTILYECYPIEDLRVIPAMLNIINIDDVEHHQQGLSGSVLFGWHIAIPHHSSPVSIFCAAAFRWRKGRQG